MTATGSPRDFSGWMKQIERDVRNARRAGASAAAQLDEVVTELPKITNPGIPTAPVEVVSEATIFLNERTKRYAGVAYVSFPPVTKSTTGKDITPTGYELQGHIPDPDAEYGAVPSWATLGRSETPAIVTGGELVPNSTYIMRVRAEGGVWSEEFEVRIVRDTTPPPQPTAPAVTALRGVIQAEWDGLAVTGQMPPDFAGLIVAAGTSANPTTEVARLDLNNRIYMHVGSAYYEPIFIRFRAVDAAGNLSPWSEQGSGTLTPLVDVDVILTELDAARTVIKNAGEIIVDRQMKLSDRLREGDLALDAVRDYAAEQDRLLDEALQDARDAISDTDRKLTGPGGLTERLRDAEALLADVGGLTVEQGKTLRQKLAEAEAATTAVRNETNTLKNTTIPKLTTDLTAATTRLTAAEGEIDTAQADITATKADLASTKQIITTNKSAMDAAVVRLGTAESEITAAKTRLGTAESSINTLRNTTIPQLNTGLSSAADRITSAEQSLTLIPGNIQSAKDAAIAAAYAEAERQAAAATAAAATDAAAKAGAARQDAISAAALDATAKANAARDASLAAAASAAEMARTAAGLASSMGRTWFQPDAPPAGQVYNWAGNRSASASELSKGGVVLRRNIITNPRFLNGLGGWSGTNATWKYTATRVTSVPAQHREFLGSDTAMRCEWAEGGTNGPYFGYTLPAALTEETPVSFKLRAVGLSGKPVIRPIIEVFNAASVRSGTITGAAIEVTADSQHDVVLEGLLPAGTGRIVLSYYLQNNSGKAGDALLMTSALGELGTKGDYFDGDSPDEREFDLWIDTANGNTPKRWNGTGWAAVTDQAAITAATTAAAADAKAKADAALATALNSAARGDNVVINGSFEQDLTGWEPENTPDPTMFGIDSTVSRSGNKSFWTVGKGGFRQLGIPVTPGQTWELSCWYKTDGAYSSSNAGGLRIQARNATAWADGSTNALRSNADWTRATIRYVVPAGVTQIRARFAFNYTGGAKAWLDDFELVNITADLAAAADAQAKADAALALANAANAETNRQLSQLAANAGNMAPYGDLESLSGTYFPLNASTARSGERCFTYRIGQSDVSAYMPDIAVTPGNWYQVSFWIKADRDITVQAGMPMTWVRADGTHVTVQNRGDGYTLAHRNGALTSEYRQLTYTVQAEQGMKAMRPRFFVQGASSVPADSGATVYMDDFILKDVTEYRLGLAATDQARLEALAAASKATDEARAAAGLANSMGRAWFQPGQPPNGVTYDWTGKAYESTSVARDASGALTRTNMATYPSPGVVGWGGRTNSGTSAITAPFRNEPAPGGAGFRRTTLTGVPATGLGWYRLTGRVADSTIVPGKRYRATLAVRGSRSGMTSSVAWRWHSGTAWLTETGGTVTGLSTDWKVFSFEAVAPATAIRLDFDFGGNNADAAMIGDYVDMAYLLLTEVEDPSTEFFHGDTPDERETDLWIDTDDGNTPKRWNGSGWAAVTDEKAIAAATAAAAADATLKANAARDAGVSAAETARAAGLAAASAAAELARNAAGLAGTRGRTWFQPEQPPLGTTYVWEGAADTSRSVMKVDGLEVRRNHFPNPGANSGRSMSGWSGNAGNVSVTATVDAPWSKSGKAHRRTWPTVTNQTGDHSISLYTSLQGGIGFGNMFTVSAKVRIGGAIQRLNAVRVYSHISPQSSGAYTHIDGSPQMAIMPGSTYTIWATGIAREDITNDFRLLVDPRPLADGDYIEFSEVMVYEGPHDPEREWFWGDTPDERATDLWIDTDEGNTPKVWTGGQWVASTDQAAIAAATAAAAADATAKANAAKAEAISAAAGDATAKANAARELAERNAAADATAKTEAAKTALTNALTADAAAKIATAKQEALTAAAADAQSKANAAKAAAEQAAATHAAGLASGAQQAAIDAAATDAATKAAAAQQAAITAAATEAARVAGLAQTNAINAARNAAVELANAAKADAIDAAALDASFKADEAERRAKVDAAAAKARADTAVADAAAAAGIANGKGKVLVQNGAPAAADRNAQTLWIDTTGGANTPKRWTTGTTWVAVTDKVATDAAARAATAITDAANAAAAAGRAQTAADNAMSAAGSKSTIFYSTANPSGIASVNDTWRKIDAQKNVIGEWRYVGGSTPWQAQLITSEAISNLDVGKLTANTAVVNELVAQKIAAATASFQRVDAKNLFVTGTATLEEAVARRLAAETGTFITLTTDQLTAGSANLGEAVAQKIAAATATFQKVTVENITATATANLNSVVAQRIAAGTASFQTVKVENITATASANLNSVVAQRIAAGTASFQTVDAKNIFVTGNASLNEATARRFAAETGTFITLGVGQLDVSGNANFKSAVADKMFANMLVTNRITTQHMLISNFDNLLPNGNFDHGQTGWGTADYWSLQTSGGRITPNFMRCMGITERVFGPTNAIDMEVNENDYYRISGWVRTNATTGSPRAELCWYWYTAARTYIGNNNFNIDTATADWTQHSHSVVAPAGAKYLRVRINAILSHTAQYMDFDDLTVALATDASLVVNGSITAKHITASEELSAKVGQFLKLDVVDLVATGSARVNEAVITKLFTETFSTRKLYSNQVIIGQPNNVIPDPNFSDPEQMARINRASTATVTLSPDGDHAVLAPVSGTNYYYRPLGVTQSAAGAKDWINVQPGEVWEWGVTISQMKGTGNWIQFVGRTIDGSAYKNPSGRTTLPAGNGTYKVRVTIPADCYWIMPEMQVNDGTQWVKKGSLYMKQIVDESLIVDGGILARHITASQALSAKVASFLEVTASQVYIGSGANLVPDPTFRNPQKIMSIGNNGVGWLTYKSGTNASGAQAIQYVPRLADGVTPPDGFLYPLGYNNAGASDKTEWLPCTGGEKYEFTYRAYFGANTGTVQFRCYANVLLEDGSIVSGGSSAWQTTGGNKSFEFVMPENAKSFGVTIQVKLPPENSVWWSIYGQNLSLVRKIDTALIVDGAITTRKLTVTEDMTVELLKAHKVLAGEINVNSLAADTGFIGGLRTHFLYSDVFSGKTFTGGTFTGTVFQSTATNNRGVKLDANGLEARNSAQQRTFFLSSSTGEVEASGSFKSEANGISASLTTQNLGGYNRPMLAFRTPAHSANGYSPMIFAEGNSTGSRAYGEGSLVLISSEQTANSSGRSELVLRRNGEGGYLGTQYGTNAETGIRWNDGQVFVLGLSPAGQYARQMLRHGKSAGARLNAGATLDWTFTYAAPAIGHLLRPIVTIDCQPPAGFVVGLTVYSVYNSTFKARVTGMGTGYATVTTIFYLAVWGSDD